MACAGGGACFPMHFDSDEAVDGRRLSAIFYLNPGAAGLADTCAPSRPLGPTKSAAMQTGCRSNVHGRMCDGAL